MLSMQFPMRDFSADYKYIVSHVFHSELFLCIGRFGFGRLLFFVVEEKDESNYRIFPIISHTF